MTHQLDLFTDAPALPSRLTPREQARVEREGRSMARTSDPISSHEAADTMVKSGAADAQRERAVDAVFRWPGKSSKELSELSGEDRHMLGRRLPEAAERGLIERREPGGKGTEITWWPK